jgi:hypothetical protein
MTVTAYDNRDRYMGWRLSDRLSPVVDQAQRNQHHSRKYQQSAGLCCVQGSTLLRKRGRWQIGDYHRPNGPTSTLSVD